MAPCRSAATIGGVPQGQLINQLGSKESLAAAALERDADRAQDIVDATLRDSKADACQADVGIFQSITIVLEDSGRL